MSLPATLPFVVNKSPWRDYMGLHDRKYHGIPHISPTRAPIDDTCQNQLLTWLPNSVPYPNITMVLAF